MTHNSHIVQIFLSWQFQGNQFIFPLFMGVSHQVLICISWTKTEVGFFPHCYLPIAFFSLLVSFLDLSPVFYLQFTYFSLVDFQYSSQSRLFTFFICLVYFGQVFICLSVFIYCLVVLIFKTVVVKLRAFSFIQTFSKRDLRGLTNKHLLKPDKKHEAKKTNKKRKVRWSQKLY